MRDRWTGSDHSSRSYAVGVIDDDASILRALRRLLGAAGFDVTTFASGEELVASQNLDLIDCLVVDIQMAGLSGFELHERLAETGRSLPIVFITAHDDAATRERAQQVPKSQYLRKPFDEGVLIQAINTVLSKA